MFSLHIFGNDADLEKVVREARFSIANRYSVDELMNIVYSVSPDSVKRRMQTEEIRSNFSKWKNLKEIKTKIEDDTERQERR